MTSLTMPPVAEETIAAAEHHADQIERLLERKDVVVRHLDERKLYESDALNSYTAVPMLVVLPYTTDDVAKIMAYCFREKIAVVPRGAGTSLTGGALPVRDGIVLSMARMRAVLDYDPASRLMRVQAGTTNLSISDYADGDNLFYAPDPSSQLACTIGGNIAMNSGGAHSLKYGVTTNNIVAATFVTAEGEVCTLGSAAGDSAGLDLMGIITGSEGSLGLVTEVTVRLLPKAPGARPILLGFGDNASAGSCVAAIIAAGIIPVAIEFMDKPSLQAIEHYAKAGYPTDCAAVLIVEVEGSEAEIDTLLEQVCAIAQPYQPTFQRIAKTETERELLWKGRKAAFSAVGQLAPDYFCIDGVIPHGQLAHVLRKVEEISTRYGLMVANVFHAGDGNLHPLILFDANKDQEQEKAEACGAEILKLCVDVGGCLSGEHGIGVEKRDLMPYQFNAETLRQHYRLRRAFDAEERLNPGKILPFSEELRP